jgi:hypothetical protein
VSAAVLAGAALGLAVPTASADPDASAEPGAAAVTDVPAMPDAAEEQDVPEVPDAAEEQNVPEVPDAAEEQDVPEVPDAAEEDVPEVPDAAEGPAVEVSPSSASPGGRVSVSVSCEPTDGSPPATIDATSRAFDGGSAQLRLVPGNDDGLSGPAYTGTAGIAPADTLTDTEEGGASASAWTVDGSCPAAPGGKGKQWSTTFAVDRGSGTQPCTTSHSGSCATGRPCAEPHAASCGGKVPHGVRAGEGGTFTDSVPALVAGGLLIAGALGAAVHRLSRRNPTADG